MGAGRRPRRRRRCASRIRSPARRGRSAMAARACPAICCGTAPSARPRSKARAAAARTSPARAARAARPPATPIPPRSSSACARGRSRACARRGPTRRRSCPPRSGSQCSTAATSSSRGPISRPSIRATRRASAASPMWRRRTAISARRPSSTITASRSISRSAARSPRATPLRRPTPSPRSISTSAPTA